MDDPKSDEENIMDSDIDKSKPEDNSQEEYEEEIENEWNKN